MRFQIFMQSHRFEKLESLKIQSGNFESHGPKLCPVSSNRFPENLRRSLFSPSVFEVRLILSLSIDAGIKIMEIKVNSNQTMLCQHIQVITMIA